MVSDSGFGIIRVKASLQDVFEKDRLMLKRFGGVVGETISRDFIVPDDIPLWALNHVLLTAFGFLNEHLHSFSLTEEDLIKLTDDNAMKWLDFVGVLFRTPVIEDGDDFWCDDYNSGSFRSWRRKKYTGPYVYKGICDTYDYSRESIKDIHPDDVYYAIMYKANNGMEFCAGVIPEKYYIPNVIPSDSYSRKLYFKDLNLDEVGSIFKRSVNCLIETLTVREIMDKYTDRIKYKYDFGDGWEFLLEFSRDECSKEAKKRCLKMHRPVMIHADGINLVEDSGGVSGFVAFLLALYGSPRDKAEYEGRKNYMEYSDDAEDTGYGQYESRDEALDWAYDLDWKEKNPSLNSWF